MPPYSCKVRTRAGQVAFKTASRAEKYLERRLPNRHLCKRFMLAAQRLGSPFPCAAPEPLRQNSTRYTGHVRTPDFFMLFLPLAHICSQNTHTLFSSRRRFVVPSIGRGRMRRVRGHLGDWAGDRHGVLVLLLLLHVSWCRRLVGLSGPFCLVSVSGARWCVRPSRKCLELF